MISVIVGLITAGCLRMADGKNVFLKLVKKIGNIKNTKYRIYINM